MGKRINKRMEASLEILSPKQLRKLSMEYFNNIGNLEKVSWTEMCQGVKIDDDFEFLTDFLGVVYEMATLHEKDKKGFKIGHVLVTSKQTQAILSQGIKSVRITSMRHSGFLRAGLSGQLKLILG